MPPVGFELKISAGERPEEVVEVVVGVVVVLVVIY
jgi:hypothetical protein